MTGRFLHNESIVIIEGLRKSYRQQKLLPAKEALCGISFVIPRGSIFGLLGPNGAGKSTIINIMAGLVLKTAGKVEIAGANIDSEPRRVQAAIGVVPQELNIDPFFTPFDLLEFQAGLYGVPRKSRRTMEILEALGLADKANAYARSLSGGMRRRLMVAKALVHRPAILVLDEPTAGVDVELRRNIWAYVRSLNAKGTTILLTTHYLEEAERLCDYIAIVTGGRLVACESKTDLMKRLDHKELVVFLEQTPQPLPAAIVAYGPTILKDGQLLFRFPRDQKLVAKILAAVQETGIGIIDVTTKEPDLEDVFLNITNAKSRART